MKKIGMAHPAVRPGILPSVLPLNLVSVRKRFTMSPVRVPICCWHMIVFCWAVPLGALVICRMIGKASCPRPRSWIFPVSWSLFSVVVILPRLATLSVTRSGRSMMGWWRPVVSLLARWIPQVIPLTPRPLWLMDSLSVCLLMR